MPIRRADLPRRITPQIMTEARSYFEIHAELAALEQLQTSPTAIGLLARSLDQKTRLGAYLDPIADKLLLSSSFVVLALNGQIRWWLTILVLGRDVLILTTAAVILLTAGYRALPPSIYGKLTTTLQIILVFTVLAAAVFHHPVFLLARRLLVYVVAGCTVFSGFHYSVVVARRLSHESPEPS